MATSENRILKEHCLATGHRLQIIQGDITLEKVEAIVNAANANLQHGGGVARAIVQRGGFQIQAESNEWVSKRGPISYDKPAYTKAGNLPCNYIIHAVGPIWGSGDEDFKLREAVNTSLQLADQLKLKSIAFPAISTGIFGFPKERAAGIILTTFKDYFTAQPESGIELVRLTLFDQPTIAAFLDMWQSKGF